MYYFEHFFLKFTMYINKGAINKIVWGNYYFYQEKQKTNCMKTEKIQKIKSQLKFSHPKIRLSQSPQSEWIS